MNKTTSTIEDIFRTPGCATLVDPDVQRPYTQVYRACRPGCMDVSLRGSFVSDHVIKKLDIKIS